MAHYDGNPQISLERVRSVAAGDGANVSRLDGSDGAPAQAPLEPVS